MSGTGRAGRGAGAVAVSCALAVLAGCAAVHPAPPASRPAGGLPTGAQRRALAAQYLAIAKAGNQRLETGFDRLHGRDRGRLAAARADLRDIAATERLFDRRLLRIAFPARTEAAARRLYQVNQARADLTSAAVAAPSLRQLQAALPRLTAASGPVEQAVRVIRRQLGLPPPANG